MFTGGHVLLEGMYYKRACFAAGDVFLGCMFYRRAYLTGCFVVQATSYMRTSINLEYSYRKPYIT